jgi:hypothetical protein
MDLGHVSTRKLFYPFTLLVLSYSTSSRRQPGFDFLWGREYFESRLIIDYQKF